MINQEQASPENFNRRTQVLLLSSILASIVIGVFALISFLSITSHSKAVIFSDAQDLIDVERLRIQAEKATSSARAFLITRDQTSYENIQIAREKFNAILSQLDQQSVTPQGQALANKLQDLEASYVHEIDKIILRRNSGALIREISSQFETWVSPKRELLENGLNDYVNYKRNRFESGKIQLESSYRLQMLSFLIVSIFVIVFAGGITGFFGRKLNHLYEQSKSETRLREEMVAIVSHDLKTPLTALSLTNTLIKKFLNQNQVWKRYPIFFKRRKILLTACDR